MATTQTKRTSMIKKPILIVGGIALLVILGIAGYALWQNLGAHAAGTVAKGWTSGGQITINTSKASLNSANKTSTATIVANAMVCKTLFGTGLGAGYKVLGRIQIASTTHSNLKVIAKLQRDAYQAAAGNLANSSVGSISTTGYSPLLKSNAIIQVMGQVSPTDSMGISAKAYTKDISLASILICP